MPLPEFLGSFARVSLQAGLLALMVLGVQWTFRRHLAPRWRCALWGVVLLRLLLPVTPSSSWSVFNWLGFGSALRAPSDAALGNRDQAQAGRRATISSSLRNQQSSERKATVQPGKDRLPLSDPQRPVAPQPRPSGPVLQVNAVPSQEALHPQAPNDAPAIPGLSGSPALEASTESRPRLAGVLFAVWLTGVIALGTHVLIVSLRLNRRIAGAHPLTNSPALDLLEDCKQLMAVQTPILVIESPRVAGPALYGFQRPRLLLPEGFTDSTPREELRFVFLHELAHVKRRDIALNWLVTALQILHWFNPLLWLAFARFRTDRELACDALALTQAGEESSEAYGRTILRLLQRFACPAPVPGMVGILEDGRQLRRRIAMIANFRPAPRWSALGLFLVAFLAAFTLTDARSAEDAPARRKLPPVVPITLTNLFAPEENRDWQRPLWQAVPRGTNEFAGIEFRMEGLLQLQGNGPKESGKKYRESIVVPVPTNTWGAVHLIAGTSYDAEPGTRIADVVWRYTDKTFRRVPVQYAVHARDWWRAPYEEPARVSDAHSKVIWRGTHADAASNNKTLRLYKTTLANPLPEKRVRAVELASANARPSLFVAALTLDPLKPGARPDDSADLELVDPPLTNHLSLSVVDEADAKPVGGAEIRWRVWRKKDVWQASFDRRLTNDLAGLATLDLPAEDVVKLEVQASRSGYAALANKWLLGDTNRLPTQFTLKLRSALEIGGVIQDSDGNPLPGAPISAYRYRQGGDPEDTDGLRPEFPTRKTQSDAEGRWRIVGVPGELVHRIAVEVQHPDYLTGRLFPIGDNPATLKALKELRHEFKLQRGLELNGLVVDADGTGIAGAKVAFGRPNFRNRRDTTTDADGRFRFRNLDPKAGDIGLPTEPVSAAAKGFQAGVTNVTMGEKLADVLIQLSKGQSLRGRVVNPKGEPLEGAKVILEGHQGGQNQYAPWDFETTTDAAGRFSWDSAPSGTFEYTFFMADHLALRGVKLEASETEHVITMRPTATLVGQVVDAKSGRPVTRFALLPADGDGAQFHSWSPSDQRDFADADGRFELPLLEERYNTLKVTSDDYAPRFLPIPEPREGRVPILIELEPSAGIRGQVVTRTGVPVAGVQVAAWSENRGTVQFRRSGLEVNSSDRTSVARTDEEGRFRLKSLGPTPCTVAAMAAPGFALVTTSTPGQEVQLVLQPLGAVEGTLYIAGQPAAGVALIFQIEGGLWATDGSLQATTDARGHFRIEGVPPGQHTISRQVRNVPNGWTYSHGTPVTVPPGGTVQVELRAEGAILQGVATLPTSVAPENSMVIAGMLSTAPLQPPGVFTSVAEAQAWQTSPEMQAFWKNRKMYQFPVGPDGKFLVDGVAPGNYQLAITASVRSKTSDFGSDTVATRLVPVNVPEDADAAAPLQIGVVELLAPEPPARPK